MLGEVDLPNVTNFVVTTGKVDVGDNMRTHNVEAGYPQVIPFLTTQSRWAIPGNGMEPRFRDGYDLFCFRGLIRKHSKFEFAILLRGGPKLLARWTELRESVHDKLFSTFGGTAGAEEGTGNVIVNLRDERSLPFLDLAVDFYRTGAAYGLEEYSLHTALQTAARASAMVDAFDLTD